MLYLTLDDCRRVVFPYIYENLTVSEPAPAYEGEQHGLQELEKVLQLVQESYYPEVYDKAAYLVSSIAGSQYFSNGNKRLAVVVLLAFLLFNEVEIKQFPQKKFALLLESVFPKLVWEDNKEIQDPHALFLYNLALVIGDRNLWGEASFSELWGRVSGIFKMIYRFR